MICISMNITKILITKSLTLSIFVSKLMYAVYYKEYRRLARNC